MKWIALHDKNSLKPLPGERCLISFEAAPSHIRACYFDNSQSFNERAEAEQREPTEIQTGPGYKRGWFTDCHDQDDWWEPKYVAFWAPLILPPSC